MRQLVKGLVIGLAAVATATSGAAAHERAAPGSSAAAPGGPPAAPAWVSCEAALPQPSPRSGADALRLPHLEPGFVPAAAVFCSVAVEARADGGQDLVAIESRAAGVAALVATLRLPDEPRTSGPCVSMLPGAPWFALLDDRDRWVRPGLPTTRCGFMREEVEQAIAGLALTRVRTRVLREVESAAAAAAGCVQVWKDVLAIETTTSGVRAGAAGRTGRGALPDAKQVRLCVYRVPGTDRTGDFDHGGILPADRQSALRRALSKAGPARPCSASATRFALLRSADYASGEIYVELDGCHRILMVPPPEAGPVLAQGDAGLAALLDRS